MLQKNIVYWGRECTLACDGNCGKAWGNSSRKKEQLSSDEDDFEFLADRELKEAPKDPGTYEGHDGKPTNTQEQLNRWCARECERSIIVKRGEPIILPDFSKRIRNIQEAARA
jgi:hypothetical protein